MAVKTQSERSKIKRARSWTKNQAAKKERVAEQAKRQAYNLGAGSTGKQRDNELRKVHGVNYRAAKKGIDV